MQKAMYAPLKKEINQISQDVMSFSPIPLRLF